MGAVAVNVPDSAGQLPAGPRRSALGVSRGDPRTLQTGGGAVEETSHLARIAADAAAKTANRLVHIGWDEAWAEGSTVHARQGDFTFILRNDVQKGPPGNRDRMLDMYASMVVRNLLAGRPGR